MRTALFFTGIGALIIIGGWFLLSQKTQEVIEPQPIKENAVEKTTPSSVQEIQGASIGSENEVSFVCDEGKTITAVFARTIVGITLSDGRQIELREAASGSGIRYLNNTETIEFRGQGSEGFLVENGKTTYANCTVKP